MTETQASSSPFVARDRWTVRQVLEATPFTERTVRQWIADGKVDIDRIGNRVLITRESLEALLLRGER